MKNILWGFVVTAIAFSAILIIVTINAQMTRKKEVNSTLSIVVNQAVNNVMEKRNYNIDEKDQFIADVLENLLDTYSNNSDITIKIAKADIEKGLLGIKVVETYKNPNGTTNTYSYEKTIILETTSTQQSFIITFLNIDGSVFQQIVSNGSELIQPPTSKPAGVIAWKRQGTTIVLNDDDISKILVTENIIYEPVQ